MTSNPSNPPLDEEVTQSLQAEGELIDEGIEETLLPTEPSQETSGCPQKPESGNRHVTGHFGHCQMHNKQLMVHPCRMIIACATFFGSETIPQTMVSILKNSHE